MSDTASIISLLEKLIHFESTSNNITELNKITDFIEGYFKSSNLYIERLTDNNYPGLIVAKEKQQKYRIIMNAHIDVVPGKKEQFTMQIKDNKAYGRGVVDMKGAAAVMMELFKNLAQEGTLPSDVALTFVADEEIGGHHGISYQLKKDILADFFVAGEPTNFTINTELKGAIKVEVVQKGKAAHGSKPWDGTNANVLLAEKIAAFYKAQTPSANVWETTYTLALLSGGTALNVVAPEAKATFDIRRIAEDTLESIVQKLETFFPDTTITVLESLVPLKTSPDNKYIQALQKTIEEHTSQKAAFSKETFTADAREYAAKGVPSINFGPIGGELHGDGEWLDLASLSPYYQILKDLLIKNA